MITSAIITFQSLCYGSDIYLFLVLWGYQNSLSLEMILITFHRPILLDFLFPFLWALNCVKSVFFACLLGSLTLLSELWSSKTLILQKFNFFSIDAKLVSTSSHKISSSLFTKEEDQIPFWERFASLWECFPSSHGLKFSNNIFNISVVPNSNLSMGKAKDRCHVYWRHMYSSVLC